MVDPITPTINYAFTIFLTKSGRDAAPGKGSTPQKGSAALGGVSILIVDSH